jgi:putative transcriptional regulator
MQVGIKVRRIRKEKGMTQMELGKAIGVSQRNISDLESGKTKPRSEIVNRIAKVLGCQAEELFSWAPGAAASPGQKEGLMESPFVLPVRATVPFTGFEWPDRLVTPVQLINVPAELYEGQRLILRAGDNSMEPEIRLNDLCVFDPALAATHGCIVCAQLGKAGASSCMVRWYLDTTDAIVLNPENMRSTEVEPIVLVRQRGGVYRYLGEEVELDIKGVLAGIIRPYALPR